MAIHVSLLMTILWIFYLKDGHSAFTNRGTEFIIAYSENVKNSNSYENSEPVYPLELFILGAVDNQVTVDITAPSFSSYLLSEQATVNKGDAVQLDIDVSLRLQGTERANKGILIQSTDDIVVVGINRQYFTSDGFLAIPTDMLGTRYYAITYYPNDYSQFTIVGTEDGTNVEITISDNSDSERVEFENVNYNSGDTVQLTLDRYEVVQIQSAGDLTGTLIVTDKPVACFSGNRRTTVGTGYSSDHLVDQLTSTDRWGKKFVVTPIPDRTVGDIYKIVASADSTQVSVDCLKDSDSFSTTITLSNAGDFEAVHIQPGKYCYLNSNHAIMVVHFVLSQTDSGDLHDPAMILVTPVEQYSSDYMFTTPRISGGSYENFFMFVIKSNEKSGLRVDGYTFPADTVYQQLPNTDLVAGYITVGDGYHEISHISSIVVFGGFIYGRAQYESYGIPVGTRLGTINAPCVVTTGTPSDGIDNDCDGLTDEEYCMEENNQTDDDQDGLVDEDCAVPRPVDGGWVTWTSWGECSLSCTSTDNIGSTGTRARIRNCTDPSPQYGGEECTGEDTETITCTVDNPCPVDGGWTSWEEWSSCSMTCNPIYGTNFLVMGTMTRSRSCSDPLPDYGGNPCAGNSSDTKYCEENIPCPVVECGVIGDHLQNSETSACGHTVDPFSVDSRDCIGYMNEISDCASGTQSDVSTTTAVTMTTDQCSCPVAAATNVTSSGDLNKILQELDVALRRNRKDLSKYKRSLYSAPDSRSSSALIGALMWGVTGIFGTSFLIMDLEKIYRFCRERRDYV